MTHILIQDHISTDAVEAFEQITDAARNGIVLGAAFALLLKRRRFMVNICGEAARDPVMVRGAILSLDDYLRDLVVQRVDARTTL